MSLSAEFDSRADRRAYAAVAAMAAALSYYQPARSSCPSWAPPGRRSRR